MHRAEYIVKRLAFALMTVFVAITINFAAVPRAPGNAVGPARRAPHASPDLRAALTHEFGLDSSLWPQYFLYLDQLFSMRTWASRSPIPCRSRRTLTDKSLATRSRW